MASRQQFKQSQAERKRRRFSEEFRRKKVREIEQKITTITEVSRQYEVTMCNVGRWLIKYGTDPDRGKTRTIVESESDTRKLLEMKAKIAELERIIGQKQVELDFKEKMIELAEETYQVDIKKKFGSKPSSGTGNTGKNSPVA